MEAISSCSCCYGAYSCVAAGCDALAATIVHVWQKTVGLVLHRMILLAARQTEWLGEYYREHPNAVMAALICIIIGIASALLSCFCFSEDEEPEFEVATPPTRTDQVNINDWGANFQRGNPLSNANVQIADRNANFARGAPPNNTGHVAISDQVR